MSRKIDVTKDHDQRRLGKLPPRYKFFLNPFTDLRFTSSCPSCCGKTRQRKLPLAIHVGDWGIVLLNKTCRFCSSCELLIGHQDEIEGLLAQLFTDLETEVIGADYLVVGTVERKDWRRGLSEPLSNPKMLESLQDFQDHLHFERVPRWEYTGTPFPQAMELG